MSTIKTVYKNECMPCNVMHYLFDCIIVYMQNHDHIDIHTIYLHCSKQTITVWIQTQTIYCPHLDHGNDINTYKLPILGSYTCLDQLMQYLYTYSQVSSFPQATYEQWFVMAVIFWLIFVQITMQSVHIKVESSIPPTIAGCTRLHFFI